MTSNHSIYRKEECPFGKKAVDLLKEKSIAFEDHVFKSKAEEASFKAKFDVKTTPQIFFGEERVGGYTELAAKLGVQSSPPKKQTSYLPVIAVFATTALLALATSRGFAGFMGYSLAVLALLKLMDVATFYQSFQQYDLVTQKMPIYGKLYPFIELALGLSILAGTAIAMTGGIALLVGMAGSVSIFKAVYIDKKDLNCACVGGNSKVPLGLVSFTENAAMVMMGLYMLVG